MMADEDISLNEDQILDNLDDTNGEMLNEVSTEKHFYIISAIACNSTVVFFCIKFYQYFDNTLITLRGRYNIGRCFCSIECAIV